MVIIIVIKMHKSIFAETGNVRILFYMDEGYLGVDFGGTKVKFAVADKKLKPLKIFSFPTGKIEKSDDIISVIRKGFSEASKISRIRAVGIGIAGMVNPWKGVAVFLTNLGGLSDVPLSSLLSDTLGVPVFIDNDVNVALFGESRAGVLKNVKNALFVAVGTGVGGAILLSEKLYVGKDGFAGEFGHITVRLNGLKCNCGKRGCLETESSGKGIERFVLNRKRRGAKTEIDKIDAKRIAYFAKRGDPLAVKAFENAVKYLAMATGNLINIFNPEFVVFGGGVTESGLIVEKIRKLLPEYALKSFLPSVRITESILKNDAGAIGAAHLSFERLTGKDVYV